MEQIRPSTAAVAWAQKTRESVVDVAVDHRVEVHLTATAVSVLCQQRPHSTAACAVVLYL